jgi:ABC-type nitrate/sulfonate/bicarbonate transport system substrate-binding protein
MDIRRARDERSKGDKRMRRMISYALLFLFGAGICVLLFKRLIAPPSQTPTQQIVRVGYLRLLSAAPLFTAYREGYFATQGISVKLRVIGSGPEGNEALASGNIDVALSIVPSLIVGRIHSVPSDVVSIYGASIDSPSVRDHRVIVRRSSGIKAFADLKGKRVGIVGWPGMTSDVLEFLDTLNRNGLKQQDLTLVGMPHGSMLAAIRSGVIDAAAAAEPYVTIGVLGHDITPLAQNDGYYYDSGEVEVTTYLARKSWVDNHQSAAIAFVKALGAARQKDADTTWLCNQALPMFNPTATPGIDFIPIDSATCLQMHMPGFRDTLDDSGIAHVEHQLKIRGVIPQTWTHDRDIVSSPLQRHAP